MYRNVVEQDEILNQQIAFYIIHLQIENDWISLTHQDRQQIKGKKKTFNSYIKCLSTLRNLIFVEEGHN